MIVIQRKQNVKLKLISYVIYIYFQVPYPFFFFQTRVSGLNSLDRVTESTERSGSWLFPKSNLLAEYGMLQFLDDNDGKNARLWLKEKKKLEKNARICRRLEKKKKIKIMN